MCASKPKTPPPPEPPPPLPPPPSETALGFKSAGRKQSSQIVDGIASNRLGYASLRVDKPE